MKMLYLASLLAASQFVFADVADSAKVWFETSYAPNYIEPITNHPEQLRKYYINDYLYLSSEVGISKSSNSAEGWIQWWADRRSSGWNGNALERVEVEELNASTVSLRVKWSHISSGESIESCYEYIANNSDGAWRFAAVVELPCADHFRKL